MDARKIVSVAGVLGGKPVFEGTRISVEMVLEMLGAGHDVDAVTACYPALTRDDVLGAIRFAAKYMADEVAVAAE